MGYSVEFWCVALVACLIQAVGVTTVFVAVNSNRGRLLATLTVVALSSIPVLWFFFGNASSVSKPAEPVALLAGFAVTSASVVAKVIIGRKNEAR
ncbi:hypothetical protein TPB0596_10240 [Tsukamurella pulmonis]|nr:hypothetical protein TPB0596_10240 [Tsukamurella pulmonis]